MRFLIILLFILSCNAYSSSREEYAVDYISFNEYSIYFYMSGYGNIKSFSVKFEKEKAKLIKSPDSHLIKQIIEMKLNVPNAYGVYLLTARSGCVGLLTDNYGSAVENDYICLRPLSDCYQSEINKISNSIFDYYWLKIYWFYRDFVDWL